MQEMFVPPPMPQMPVSNGNSSGNEQKTGPQISNAPGFEQQSQWARSVARSGQIRSATGAVIRTRAQLKNYLTQNGMDLFTSAIEFQQTGDFILSSYVTYPNHNNFKEPLGQFLQRYPHLQAPVQAIRDQLRPVKSQMQVITPKLSNSNPFAQFGGL